MQARRAPRIVRCCLKIHRIVIAMVEYLLTENKSSENTTEYGIMAIDDSGEKLLIDSIAENKSDVKLLCEMLTELDVELCHFENIVEDYLTDFCI